MGLFIDSANIGEIREIARWGVVQGVTTNPKIFSSEETDLKTRVSEILNLVPGPLSLEVTTNDLDEMILEAEKFASWSEHVVVKLPMSPVGLQALSILKEKGVRTNLTAIMTPGQALLAGLGGATYASIFFGRINDIGSNALEVIQQTATLFKRDGLSTKIIVGSIRVATQITEAALAGADIVTVPHKFFSQLANHPQTEKTIQEFLEAWSAFKTPA